MDPYDNLEYQTQTDLPPIPERQLQAPLTNHKLTAIQGPKINAPQYLKNAQINYKAVERSMSSKPVISPDRFHQGRVSIWRYALSRVNVPSESIDEQGFMYYAFQILDDHLMKSLKLSPAKLPVIRKALHTKEILGLFFTSQELEDAVNVSCLVNSSRSVHRGLYKTKLQHNGYQISIGSHAIMDIYNNFIVFKYSAYKLLIDHNHLLAINDMIKARLSTLMASIIDNIIDDNVSPSPPLIHKIFNWMDVCIDEKGNSGFEAIKFHEPLCVGLLLRTGEKDLFCDDSKFFNQMYAEVREISNGKMMKYLDLWVTELYPRGCAPEVINQCRGLFRHGSHPDLDSLKGLNEMKFFGHVRRSADPSAVRELMATAKRDFFTAYRAKHLVWPPNNTELLYEESELKKALDSGLDIDEHSVNYNPKEWSLVQSKKTFHTPNGESMAILVSDKAQLLRKTEVLETLRYSKYALPTERVIKGFLYSNETQISEFIDSVIEKGFSEEDLLVGERLKEREVKPKGRMFSVCTPRLRSFFQIGELEVARNILPYYPHITMKDKNLTLKKKMNSASKSQNTIDHMVTVVIVLDFRKWNLMQDQSGNKDIMEWFDDLHGYDRKFFARTHPTISQCQIILCDGSGHIEEYEGEIIGPGQYRDHLAGFEGLRQKPWTIKTSSAIKTVCDTMNVKCSILGQGDNQVVALHFPSYDTDSTGKPAPSEITRISKTVEKILDGIEDMTARLGLELKKEESWTSSKVFEYGKVTYFKGRPLPSSLKSASRCSYMVNDGFPSLSGSLSAVSSSLGSICDTSITTHTGLIMYVIEASRCILEYIRYDISIQKGLRDLKQEDLYVSYQDGDKRLRYKISDRQFRDSQSDLFVLISLLINVDSSLGGMAVASPLTAVLRMFPDPVTQAISHIKTVMENTHNIKLKRVLMRVLSPRFKKTPDPIMLCQDPTSLNILVPVREENVVKGFATQMFKELPIKNRMIKILAKKSEDLNMNVINALFSEDRVYPNFMSSVFSCTPRHVYETITARYKKTNTMRDIIYNETGDQLSKRLARCDIESFIHMLEMIVNEREIRCDLDDSPTALAQTMRKESWSKEEVIGCDVTHPFWSFGLHVSDGSRCSYPGCAQNSGSPRQNYITAAMSPDVVVRGGHFGLHQVGGLPLYIGSETREKATDTRLRRPVDLTGKLRETLDLSRLRGWVVKEDSNADSMIEAIIAAVTDYPYDELYQSIVIGSGSHVHRMHDPFSRHGGATVGISPISSHLAVSTTTLEKYSKGGTNHNINFQSVLSCLSALVSNYLVDNQESQVPHCFHLHITDAGDIRPIYEGYVDVAVRFSPGDVDNPLGSEIFSIPRDEIRFNSRVLMSLTTVPRVDILKHSAHPKMQLQLSIQIGRMLMSEGVKDLVLSGRDSILERGSKTNLVLFYKVNPVDLFIGAIQCVIELCIKGYRDQDGYDDGIQGLTTLLINRLMTLKGEAFLYISHITIIKDATRYLTANGLMGDLVSQATPSFPVMQENARRIMLQIVQFKQVMLYSKLLLPKVIENLATVDMVQIVSQYSGQMLKGVLEDPIGYNWRSDMEVMKQMWSYVLKTYQEAKKAEGMIDPYLILHGLFSVENLETDEQRISFMVMKKEIISMSVGNISTETLWKVLEPPSLPGFDIIAPKSLLSDLTKGCATTEVKMPNLRMSVQDSSTDQRNSGPDVIKTDRERYQKEYHRNIDRNLTSEMQAILREGENIDEMTADSEPNSRFPGVFFYRTLKAGTTAPIKLASVMHCIYGEKPDNEHPKRIACMGDGNGGTVAVCLTFFSPIYVFYNSRIVMDQAPLHSISELECPILRFFPGEKASIVKGQEMLRSGVSDFTDPEYSSAVAVYRYKRHLAPFDLVISDAEHGSLRLTEGSIMYFISMLLLCLENLQENGKLCFKMYTENERALREILKRAFSGFERVSCLRSRFSVAGNSEVYLLCEGFSRQKLLNYYSQHHIYNLRDNCVRQIRSLIESPSADRALSECYRQAMMSLDHINDNRNLWNKLVQVFSLKSGFKSFLQLLALLIKYSLRRHASDILEVKTRSLRLNPHKHLSYATILRLTALQMTLKTFIGYREEPPTRPLHTVAKVYTIVYRTVSGELGCISGDQLSANEIEVMKKLRKMEFEFRPNNPNFAAWEVEYSPAYSNELKKMASMIGWLKEESKGSLEMTQPPVDIRFVKPGKGVAALSDHEYVNLGAKMKPRLMSLEKILLSLGEVRALSMSSTDDLTSDEEDLDKVYHEW